MKKFPVWLHFRGVPFIYRLVLFFCWVVLKLFYRHKVYGAQHFCKGPAIIAANHISFLDPPIVAISAPEEVYFLARKSLFKSNGFGALIKALNALPVSGQPSDHQVFKQIFQILNKGKKIILFPEGARSWDNVFQPIKPGVALLISRSQVPIIPVYIHGAYEVWPRGKRLPKIFGKTACVFGSPIHVETSPEGDKSVAQEAISKAILSSWNNLKKWYEDGAKGTPP